jgi:DNA-binding NarL/FixJ family response regulator
MTTPPERDTHLDFVCRLIRDETWLAAVASLGLSRREVDIVVTLLNGAANARAIGQQLGISPRTVQTHVSRLHKKLQVTNRTQLLVRLFARYIDHRRP